MNTKQNNLREWCMTGNTSGFQLEELGSNPSSRIFLDLVKNDTDKFNFDQIVINYHTYKPTVDIVGRCINWLIKLEGSHQIIGGIGIGSSVMAMKPRDDYIGWKKEHRLVNLRKTCTNWRFCLMDKGYGSKVLSVFHKEARKEWKKKYGDNLVMMETLIEPPYQGTCYKASGWTMVGRTKGMQFAWKKKDDVLESDNVVQKFMKFKDSVDYNTWKVVIGNNIQKYIFVKPLHRYWRKELMRLNEL